MFVIYDIVFFLLLLVYIPLLTIRRKWNRGLRLRLGNFPLDLSQELAQRENVWIHAVSVGEILAIIPLIAQFKQRFPQYNIVCSTVTKTGFQLAQDKLKGKCHVILAPLDFSWIVRKYIREINPVIYIATETEIWPNLFHALFNQKIPIIIINGRISDKGFKGYRKIKFLISKILSYVASFCMQSKEDAQRIIDLGAPVDRVKVLGNVKFDQLEKIADIKDESGIFKDCVLFVAGSTHPGEEEIVIDSYLQLVKEYPQLRLIITPRHVERSGEVKNIAEQKGLRSIFWSQRSLNKIMDKNEILVVDTVGELKYLYSLASIVFVGKTFRVGGGQNMIEPASFGKVVVVGPKTYNFRDVVGIFVNEKAMIQIDTEELLTETLRSILRDPQKAKRIGLAAQRVVEQYQGATRKTLDLIATYLK